MPYAKKVDSNQPELVQQLRRVPGVFVQVVSACAGLGFDLIARYQDNPPLLLEVKPAASSRLTDSEKLARKHYGPYWQRVETLEQALVALGISAEPAPAEWGQR